MSIWKICVQHPFAGIQKQIVHDTRSLLGRGYGSVQRYLHFAWADSVPERLFKRKHKKNAYFWLASSVFFLSFQSFSGICGALLIGGGFIGSVITGFIVDKTKLFEEVAKICFCLAAVAACAFGIVRKLFYAKAANRCNRQALCRFLWKRICQYLLQHCALCSAFSASPFIPSVLKWGSNALIQFPKQHPLVL